jgi:hypothetical protein
MAGASIKEIQELAGHKSIIMIGAIQPPVGRTQALSSRAHHDSSHRRNEQPSEQPPSENSPKLKKNKTV